MNSRTYLAIIKQNPEQNTSTLIIVMTEHGESEVIYSREYPSDKHCAALLPSFGFRAIKWTSIAAKWTSFLESEGRTLQSKLVHEPIFEPVNA